MQITSEDKQEPKKEKQERKGEKSKTKAGAKGQRTVGAKAKAKPLADVPSALKYFDSLPDSAEVGLSVVCGWRGSSAATVWRDVKANRLPSPRKYSLRRTTWNVGELRAAKARVK